MRSFSVGKTLWQTHAATYQQRLFSSVSASVEFVTQQASEKSRRELVAHHQQQQLILQQKYPTMLSHVFHHEIAYSLRTESPEEMLTRGGLLASGSFKTNLDWSPDSGNNNGFICLSLLPGLTTIFMEKKLTANNSRAYIYAFPLSGLFWLPGGPWRQVCSPGALPTPLWWRAREVVDIENGKIKLGKTVGQGNTHPTPCERFKSYLENSLQKPLLLNVADEDYPEIYEIEDTPETAIFQERVKEHYQQKKSPQNR
jgi:hypothetical protein